ncbi:MAG: hypothetical protein ACRDBH_05350 [Bosea sp. (in: a-proteobacteria)]
MTASHFTLLAAGIVALLLTTAAQAQFQGRPAPLKEAMTESQARSACRAEMQGGRKESRQAMGTKLRSCMLRKMNGS